MGFSTNYSFENGKYDQMKILKLNLPDFRLILLDHSTFIDIINKILKPVCWNLWL